MPRCLTKDIRAISADRSWRTRLLRFARNDGGYPLHRRALRLRPAQVLVEARHDLDEVARAIAVVELVQQDVVPSVLAGARRARQAEDVGGAGDARGGAGLNRRGADLAVAHHQEERGEAVHALFEEGLDRLRRDVA